MISRVQLGVGEKVLLDHIKMWSGFVFYWLLFGLHHLAEDKFIYNMGK